MVNDTVNLCKQSSCSRERRNEFESGDRCLAQSVGKKFCRAPPLFGSTGTISNFGERFRDGQYSLSLASLLFAALLITVPPVPSHL